MFEIKKFESSEKNVWKYVFTNEQIVAESVLYKYESFEKRTVICCSVQSGCPVGCNFCGTGKVFVKNLTSEEIVFQVKILLDDNSIQTSNIEKFQIMFMSMGEPMLNWDNVKLAIIELNNLYPNAQLLISTIGVNNELVMDDIISLSKEIDNVGLQFSIHESTDLKRNKLIPFVNKLSLQQISKFGQDWFDIVGRKPFINYCVHKDNSSESDINNIKDIFDPLVFNVTLSVICEKDCGSLGNISEQLDLITGFKNELELYGYNIRVFNPAGQDDIGGGCGQLWFVQDWIKKYKSNLNN